MPGGVVGIVTREGDRAVLPFGKLTYDAEAVSVRKDTLYDVASVTKVIPGSLALLKLLDDGLITLDDPLINYVPEFDTDPAKRAVTLRHLLTYTLDLDVPAMSSLILKGPDAIVEQIIRAPLKAVPGSAYRYNNATALFTHLIVKRVTGKTLDQFADEVLFDPLGMTRTTFSPLRFYASDIAPTEVSEWRGELMWGKVHDESSYVLQHKDIVSIAGLFSTAPDILSVLEMLLRGGEFGGRRFFSESLAREMGKDQFPESTFSTGLGWQINEPYFMGSHAEECFGMVGFTGCSVTVNQQLGVGVVLLANAIHPKRPESSASRNQLRSDLANIIFDTLYGE
jgi:CubicO group peptidase (beta-lactamase class C family)